MATPGSLGESSIMRQWSGSPAYVSVGLKRRRSRAAWRHLETSRRLSRWRCFRAHWAYWPCACAGPWQHPSRSGTAEAISANSPAKDFFCSESWCVTSSGEKIEDCWVEGPRTHSSRSSGVKQLHRSRGADGGLAKRKGATTDGNVFPTSTHGAPVCTERPRMLVHSNGISL